MRITCTKHQYEPKFNIMSDNTTDSDASLKEQIERMKEKISYKAVNYEDGLEYYRLQYEAEDDLDKLEELIRSDSRKAKASGVRVNARVIRVVGCNDPMMWYSDKIGEEFNLLREDEKYYWTREEAGFLNIVHKTDAKILQPE